MGRNTGGNPGDVRKSALWGSGNRGGEHRSNALWGKGGRGFVTTVLVIALAVPLMAGADSGPGKNYAAGKTHVSDALKQKAKTHPDELVGVIVQLDESGHRGRTRAASGRAADERELDGSDVDPALDARVGSQQALERAEGGDDRDRRLRHRRFPG